MPELPEVESIRRNLIKIIQNDVISEVKVYYRPIVSGDHQFEEKLKDQYILDIDRKGKYLFFILSDYVLVSHLRMEGKYFMDEERSLRHTHVEFILKSGHILSYHDTRKFGRFELYLKNEFQKANFNDLGDEPNQLSVDVFLNKLSKKSISIKEALLDQKIIAGIGNIYANEILYRSKIHPAKPAYMINDIEASTLIKNAKWVLDKAIRMGGTTIDTFESLGHKGMFQQELLVHGKTGEICKVCGSTIKKVQHRGRGTYYCEGCQKSYVVAVTGAIASGKSTAINYLKKKGFVVIDSDQIVKELYENEAFAFQIGKSFGALVSDKLDKQKLSAIIFNSKTKRSKLEAIIHPLVFDKIEEIKRTNFAYLIFLDIPLLFETHYKKYDKSLLIDIDQPVQLQRLMTRNNLSLLDAKRRLKSQMPLSKKRNLADAIIKNNGSVEDLHKRIDLYLQIF